MMREVVRAFKAIRQELRGSVRDWVDVVPVVQWELNTAYVVSDMGLRRTMSCLDELQKRVFLLYL